MAAASTVRAVVTSGVARCADGEMVVSALCVPAGGGAATPGIIDGNMQSASCTTRAQTVALCVAR